MNSGYHEKEYKEIEHFIVHFFGHNGSATKKYKLSYDDKVKVIIDFFRQKNLSQTIEKYIKTLKLKNTEQDDRVLKITVYITVKLLNFINQLNLDNKEQYGISKEIMGGILSIISLSLDSQERYIRYENRLDQDLLSNNKNTEKKKKK